MSTVAAKQVFEAIQGGDMVRLRELLEADPGAARATDGAGVSALQTAIYQRRHDVIRVLLQHDGLCTPYEAAALGDKEALARLIAADPALLDAAGPDGFLPLHIAAHFAQHDALEWLLEQGADLDASSTNANRNTALHAAAAGGAVATARILLASGADADATDAGGNTPLHVAAATGAVPVVEALLDGGADRDKRNEKGETPADLARQRGKEEVVTILTRSPPEDTV